MRIMEEGRCEDNGRRSVCAACKMHFVNKNGLLVL